MDENKYESMNTRQWNHQIIAQDTNYKRIIFEMRVVEKFLSNFGYLSLGRDFVVCGRHVFSLQMISTASELTVGSIISCCESGCIADAFSLLRKYRDDMFFYLYIVVYDTCSKLGYESKEVNQMKENIEQWMNNGLKSMYIGGVLKAIGQSPCVKDAVQKYNLKPFFDALGHRLNNYVHSNGVAFYNRNVRAYQDGVLQMQLEAILKDMRFITITFLFLLILCSPLSVMSIDYVDYLDCGMTPPDGSQYWVAPFVNEFFKKNIDLIDASCMIYLHDITHMELD